MAAHCARLRACGAAASSIRGRQVVQGTSAARRGAAATAARRAKSSAPVAVLGDAFADREWSDVDNALQDLFTFQAVKLVLEQLHECGDASKYKELYDFAVENKCNHSGFVLKLHQFSSDLAERVMVRRARSSDKK